MKKSVFNKRCDNFFAKWSGKKDDFDGAYKNQCVDTAKRFMLEVCDIPNPPATGNGWAHGYWYNRSSIPQIYKNFLFVTDKNKLQKGDIVITDNPHVAIYDSGRLFGQNHGGKLEANAWISFNVFSKRFLGALRYKHITDDSGDTGNKYLAKVICDTLNVRSGPGVGYKRVTQVHRGEVFTILETKSAGGYTWGRLKSGAGWIALDYTRQI